MSQVTALAGVYDADGGVRGETAYVIGHLLGRTHCALCDITHSPVRRKPEWDRMAASLPVPIRLLHRNELDAELARAIDGEPLALVAARVDGEWTVMLDSGDLEGLDGNVDRFHGLVMSRLRQRGWEPAAA